MGRYYSGDIEGKFWFGVQNSDDGDFFGVKGEPPDSILAYTFRTENIPKIKEGILKCTYRLGQKIKILDNFFKGPEAVAWNNEDIQKLLKLKTALEAQEILTWYARLELGRKILKSVQESGQCYFEAEL